MKIRHLFIYFTFVFLHQISLTLMAAQLESYTARPSIFDVPAQSSNYDARWEDFKKAQIVFVAQLLELYPESRLVFLARDAEYLFDVAQLATFGTSDFDRILLVNVSRQNMRDTNMIPYLRQNGITEESLREGNQVVLIDTGYNGTIPDYIQFQMPSELGAAIKKQMVLSKDPKIPFSRSFLFFLNKDVNRLNPLTNEALKQNLLEYESLEKFTRRSTHYKQIKGAFVPMSPLKDPRAQSSSRTDQLIAKMSAADNRSVDPVGSLTKMSDLKKDWEQPEVRSFLLQIRNMTKQIRDVLLSGTATDLQVLRSRLGSVFAKEQKQLLDSLILDAYDILKSQGYKLTLKKSDLKSKQASEFGPRCPSVF